MRLNNYLYIKGMGEFMNKDFSKTMSTSDILFLAMGAMLGWGWVVLSGEWIATAGFLGSIIAFIVGGLFIIFIGLTYAELAAAIPETGGDSFCFKGFR